MANIPFQFFEKFLNNLASKKFDFSSDASCTVTIALVAAANPPNLGTDDGLSDLTQISYTNLSGNRIVTGITAAEAAGVLPFTADDKTLAAAGGDLPAFRYVVLYDDDSTGDLLIGMFDFGSDFVIVDGAEFDIRFSNDSGKFGTLSIV